MLVANVYIENMHSATSAAKKYETEKGLVGKDQQHHYPSALSDTESKVPPPTPETRQPPSMLHSLPDFGAQVSLDLHLKDPVEDYKQSTGGRDHYSMQAEMLREVPSLDSQLRLNLRGRNLMP